tara:strand:- start:1110 stop:1361 length:252 start_codon:yes stop_codon:yes gene_type:complete
MSNTIGKRYLRETLSSKREFDTLLTVLRARDDMDVHLYNEGEEAEEVEVYLTIPDSSLDDTMVLQAVPKDEKWWTIKVDNRFL